MSKILNDKSIYSFSLPFEHNLEDWLNSGGRLWWTQNWIISFYFAVLYITIIFVGQLFMKNRSPFPLKSALFIWNLLLALFSITGTARIFPEIFDILKEPEFRASVCNNRNFKEIEVTKVWLWLFAFSKILELFDTVFIVLRKSKLIFLHYYHHTTVLLFVWLAYSEQSSIGRWFAGINFAVHSIMYSYYTITALGIRVPKVIALVITMSQVIQMVLGIFVTFYSVISKSNGYNCRTSSNVLFWAILMYSSYLVLFVNYFIQTYIKDSKRITKNKSNFKIK